MSKPSFLPSNGMWGAITSSVVNLSFIWAFCFVRTDTSSTQFSIAWREAMRLKGLSSRGTLNLAVQTLSSSFCGCNRQFCSLVPPIYACEVWAPASACIGPFRDLQQLQRIFLSRACRVKNSFPVGMIFQELEQMCWHDFWWRRVTSFWSALVEDAGSLHSMIFHDTIQLALAG